MRSKPAYFLLMLVVVALFLFEPDWTTGLGFMVLYYALGRQEAKNTDNKHYALVWAAASLVLSLITILGLDLAWAYTILAQFILFVVIVLARVLLEPDIQLRR